MKVIWLLAALCAGPAWAMSPDSENDPAANLTETDDPPIMRPRIPYGPRPWRLPQVAVSCSAVETHTNRVFQSAGWAYTYDAACRKALESAAEKCVSASGDTFQPQPGNYAACAGDSPYFHTGYRYNCRISCGPLVR